jgi:hypothetical protein
MKYVKLFGDFKLFEHSPAPAKPAPGQKPQIAPPITKPSKPKPDDPIKEPSITPKPKAVKPTPIEGDGSGATEQEVAERFIMDMKSKGESIKKYIK